LPEFSRVATASRVFSLAAILGLAVAFGNASAVHATVVVTFIAAAAAYLSAFSAIPRHWILACEAGIASLVVILTLPNSVLLLPYLVVLPLLAGLARGLVGAFLVTVLQLVAILSLAFTSPGLSGITDQVELLAPWILTIAGAGLLGAWIKKIGKAPAGSSMDERYDSARRLLGQLRNLARRLPSGLDPVSIAGDMARALERHAGIGLSVVLTRTEGGVFSPLAYHGSGARDLLDPDSSLIERCWESASAVVVAATATRPTVLVLPLRLGPDVVGAVYAEVAVDATEDVVKAVQPELDDLSLRLATGLAFDEVRGFVTSDERQRLAREIHDGVAQEVASLGYALDDLTAASTDPEVSSGLKELRGDLSRIVTELRLSIFDLRTEVGDGPGLGTALSDYVRRVGARSSMTVHLTLDEAPSRLSPGVETELFRIAQEAITNARKHSGAANLWVDCWVRPPAARISIRDDGCGIGVGRPDSFGLRIMRERADRIDADVHVEHAHKSPERPGTRVTISIGAAESPRHEGASNTDESRSLKGMGAAS
jgi:signal transduction histidine kinase